MKKEKQWLIKFAVKGFYGHTPGYSTKLQTTKVASRVLMCNYSYRVAGVTRWCHFNLPDSFFFPLFLLFKHASKYSFSRGYTHFSNLCYIQLCVKGIALSEGKFAICLDHVLKICSSGGIVACNPNFSEELTFLNKGIVCTLFDYLCSRTYLYV